MEYNTNEKKQAAVVFVEPVKVEDCPLPVWLRAWEAVKRAAFGVRRKMRGAGLIRRVLWLAVGLIGVAAAPAMLIWLIFGSLRKTRRAAGMAF